jgi:curved DNA-binding protein CbpA
VRRAYREKVKEAHPDTDSGSEEEFKRVNRAYETLTE